MIPTVNTVHRYVYYIFHYSFKGPWCYTTDKNKRFEYCDIDNCSQPHVQSTAEPVTVPSGQCGKTSVKLLIDEIQMENYSNYDSNGGCKSDCQRYRKKRDAPDVDEVEYGNIVGGVGVDSKELPWQATLNLIGCGATIVSQTVNYRYFQIIVPFNPFVFRKS